MASYQLCSRCHRPKDPSGHRYCGPCRKAYGLKSRGRADLAAIVDEFAAQADVLRLLVGNQWPRRVTHV